MKSQAHSTPLALWLDPEAALSPEHSHALQVSGWAVMPVNTLDHLLAHAADAAMVVLHLNLEVTRLKAVQQLLQDASLNLPMVCRVDRQALDLAVEATQAGALTVLAAQDVRTASWQRLHNQLVPTTARQTSQPVRNVVFVDPASQHLLALAKKVAHADVTALLVGPTGSGKEVLARVLHEASGRAQGPFVALNCAAMPENLIEDMLFGHEKGAFTGAHREQKGLFEQAQGGTLFLDEIGEMPMHLQSKLLRVLQERQLTRLGGQSVIQLNVRIVAATNKDLKKAITDREFREDLYYRIATFRMRLLPLAERPGDIIPLAMQCLLQHEKKPWQLHPQTQMQLLVTPAHLMFDDWLTASAAALEAVNLPSAPDGGLPETNTASHMEQFMAAAKDNLGLGLQEKDPVEKPESLPTDLHSAARMNEHQVIMATLASTPSKSEAAKRLGISPRTLRYKMAQLREHGLAMAAAC